MSFSWVDSGSLGRIPWCLLSHISGTHDTHSTSLRCSAWSPGWCQVCQSGVRSVSLSSPLHSYCFPFPTLLLWRKSPGPASLHFFSIRSPIFKTCKTIKRYKPGIPCGSSWLAWGSHFFFRHVPSSSGHQSPTQPTSLLLVTCLGPVDTWVWDPYPRTSSCSRLHLTCLKKTFHWTWNSSGPKIACFDFDNNKFTYKSNVCALLG